MLYKFPMPSSQNGVRLFALPDKQLGIEVARGPNATMAYDAELATGRVVTISRPGIDDEMPKAGEPPIRDNKVKADTTTMEYDDDASKVIDALLSYLEKYLDPDQMTAVTTILGSGDVDLDAGEPPTKGASDRRRPYGADDRSIRRSMSERNEAAYLQMFPQANRLG